MSLAIIAAPVPATADRPEYRGYPVRMTLTDGGTHRLSSGESVEELLSSPWASQAKTPTVIAEHVSPMGSAVVIAPWAGGTWGGMCGSVRWVVDTDGLIRQAETLVAALSGDRFSGYQPGSANPALTSSQPWWVNGLRTREEHGWDGFYVECQQPLRHDDLCRFRDWTWDGHALTVIS